MENQNEEKNILLIKLNKNRSPNRVKKILSQNYNDQMNQFIFETNRLNTYPGRFLIRTKNKKIGIITLKDFEVRSVDEYNGRWNSSRIKYVDPKVKIFGSNHYYSSIIVSDTDNVDDLAEEMKDRGFSFTILDNCLVIKLVETDESFNHKNIQAYLKKRLITCDLVNQDYLDKNKGNGCLVPSWFCKP